MSTPYEQGRVGHEYVNDATMMLSAAIYSTREAHEAVVAWLRTAASDQPFDAAAAKTLFGLTELHKWGISPRDLPRGERIDWSEVSEEFADLIVDKRRVGATEKPTAKIDRLLDEIEQTIGATFAMLDDSSIAPEEPVPLKARGRKLVKQAVPAVVTASSSSSLPSAPATAANATLIDTDLSRVIDEDVLAVLRDCTATEVGVFLPPRQLDPKLYKRVNEVLAELGGKWNTKLKCHKFAEGNPQEALATVQATGRFLNPKDFGFFPTPKELAQKAADLLGIEYGDRVLEPSAGTGALADACVRVQGSGEVGVDVVEFLDKNVAVLEGKGYTVVGRDFLAMEPTPIYDRILMNPPFGNQADMKHIEHAARFLTPTGRLVAIMSPAFQTRSTKTAVSFRALMDAAGDHLEAIPHGTFRESGTDVSTVLIAMDAERMPWNVEAAAELAAASRPRQRAA